METYELVSKLDLCNQITDNTLINFTSIVAGNMEIRPNNRGLSFRTESRSRFRPRRRAVDRMTVLNPRTAGDAAGSRRVTSDPAQNSH